MANLRYFEYSVQTNNVVNQIFAFYFIFLSVELVIVKSQIKPITFIFAL